MRHFSTEILAVFFFLLRCLWFASSVNLLGQFDSDNHEVVMYCPMFIVSTTVWLLVQIAFLSSSSAGLGKVRPASTYENLNTKRESSPEDDYFMCTTVPR